MNVMRIMCWLVKKIEVQNLQYKRLGCCRESVPCFCTVIDYADVTELFKILTGNSTLSIIKNFIYTADQLFTPCLYRATS